MTNEELAEIERKLEALTELYYKIYPDSLNPEYFKLMGQLIAALKQRDEVLEDKRRIAREFDIALNGVKDAAAQASLIDTHMQAIQLINQKDARIQELEKQYKEIWERLAPLTLEIHQIQEQNREFRGCLNYYGDIVDQPGCSFQSVLNSHGQIAREVLAKYPEEK